MSWGARGYHPHLVRGEFVETDDSSGEQAVKLYGLDGEVLSKVYRPQTFGLTSHAPVGSNGMLVSLGGERSSSFLLGGEHPDKRPTGLAEGESKLYDASGNLIYMGLRNGITLSTASGNAVVKTKSGTITLQSDGHAYVDPGGNNVYLGTATAGGARVMTESGPSRNVYAMV